MPFLAPHPEDPARWRQIHTVDLRQLPVTRRWKVYFEVLREFGYSDLPPDGGTPEHPVWSAHLVEHLVHRGMRTDLASVPSFLWGVIASYGRQTLPALLHDMLCFTAAQPDLPRPRRRNLRRTADDLFRQTLRSSGSGLIRRWLMWSAVRMFGLPSAVVAFALLVVAGLVALATGLTWDPALVGLAAGAVGTVLAAVVAAVESSPVGPARAPAVGPGLPHPATSPRFDPRAFAGILTAAAISLVAAVPILVVGVTTLLLELLVGLGERSVAEGRAGRAPADQEAGTTARIDWAPLVAPQDSTVNANPGVHDL